MQSSPQQGLKKDKHSANRFNDSEYERWSAGISARRAAKPIGGIVRFLATAENSETGPEDLSASLIEY
jgi:hypothetical protein